MEWQHRREALANGLALPEDVLEVLRALADELEIKAAWLSA
jgi:hypothetical protein